MDYQTVSSREIVIPELATTLHIHSVEMPGSMNEFADGHHAQDLDRLLVEVCQEVFRVGPNEIISFSEWSRASDKVLVALSSLRPDYFSDPSFLDAEKSALAATKEFRAPGDYLERLITDGLLVPRQRVKNPGLLWLESASSDGALAPRLFSTLAAGGVSELGFSNWYRVSQFAYHQEYPSATIARQEIPRFEVPVAGSKPIKAITIENFQKLCYGAAAMVIGEVAVSAASAVGHGEAPVIAAVLGGSVSALVFVSVGSLARYLEDFLKSKSRLAESPTTASAKGKRMAA